VQVNGDINFSLRKWKRNLKDSKIVEQLFANKFYKKPSDERREIMELAKYNEQKEG
jgi:ribosomal protein S21